MKPYQRQFIEFALGKQVLKFGEFTLKSGRKSPYFFNAGLFNTGRDLALLGRFYAEALVDSGIEFDLLFGHAYKGIPIATTTAVALAEHHDLDLPYCFNRKEAKDHGEGGNLVGSALQGRVMLVDDVITAGAAIRESMEIIQANGATLAGVLISLDRQERGRGEISAIQEVERDYNCKVISIITLKDLIAYLEEKPEMAEHLAAVRPIAKSSAFKETRRMKSHPASYYCNCAAISGQRASKSSVGRYLNSLRTKRDSIPSQKARIWLASRVSSVV